MEVEKILEIWKQFPPDQRIAFLEGVIIAFQAEKQASKDKARENGKKWGRPPKTWGECLEIIKNETGILDWTQSEQNEYSSLLVGKIKELPWISQYTRQEILKKIINNLKWDVYYWGWCSNPKKMCLNLGTLIKKIEIDGLPYLCDREVRQQIQNAIRERTAQGLKITDQVLMNLYEKFKDKDSL